MTPLENAIAVVGNHRCGTTWLAQMLAQMPGYAMLFEPIRPGYPCVAEHLGDAWRPGPSPRAHEALTRMLTGAEEFQGTTRSGAGLHGVPTIGVVGKFVRAGRLLPVLCRMPIRGTYVIVRDPCDAVNSQLRVGAHEKGTPMDIKAMAHVIAEHPHIRGAVSRLEGAVEWLAAWWCVTYLAVPRLDPSLFTLVRYERLVAAPDDELDLLFAAVGAERPRGIDPRRPSLRAKEWAGIRRGQTRTEHLMSGRQRRRILRVVSDFGLDQLLE